MTVTAPPRPGADVAPTRRDGPLHGTGALVRLALRRDRVLLPVWLIGFAAMAAFSVAATRDLYPDDASLVAASEVVNATASLIALYGKIYVPTSLGAVSLIKMTAFGAALVAVLFVFLAVRHTRSEEESGRLELVAAGAVGRDAPLAAALIVGTGAGLLLGALTTTGLVAVGLPAAGSVAFGLGWACSALVFTAIGVVVAQVTTSARAALGIGLAVVGLAYALRAVGDLAAGDPGVLSWLSPIGWSQQIRPFAGDRWWVVTIPVVVALLAAALAFVLRGHRDLGSGFLPERAGPAVGRVDGVLLLARRLQRGMLVAWLVAAVLFGLALGSVAHNVSGFFDSPQMRRYLVLLGGEQALTDAFLAAEVAILSVLVAGYGIAAVHRLRTEEASGHAELLLADGTTRIRWAASHLVIALMGTALVLVVAGAAIGLAHGMAVGEPGPQVLRMTAAAAAHVPAAWVMVGLACLVFGWVPLAYGAVWAVFAVFIALGEFGELWGVPDWVLDVSPFSHSPTVPGGDVSAATLILLVAVTAVLITLGLLGWHRRDLHP